MKPKLLWHSNIKSYKKFNIGKFEFVYERKDKSSLMGRFGGGWNWELGFRAGGKTVILLLLIASLRITYLGGSWYE